VLPAGPVPSCRTRRAVAARTARPAPPRSLRPQPLRRNAHGHTPGAHSLMHQTTAGPIGVDALRALARRSHDVIAEHQAPSGAYPASPTFSAYRGYAWYRDGAFTAEGMSRYGAVDSAGRFHDWAARVLTDRADVVAELVSRHRRG